jgi:hypothetical protein
MYIIPLHFLFACGEDPEQPPKAPGVTTHDFDGDGYTEVENDCNDEDETISPGSEEICDGLDNDCDGVVDNGVLSTYYSDEDGDGFGFASVSEEVCTGEQSEGYIEDSSDCNDLDAAINPEALEICDDVDNDCDELIDKDDDSFDQETAKEFFEDSDGDGYYTESEDAEGVIACSTPEGYTDTPGDCDDANELISPDSTEICDDVDNDCDGDIDDADNSLDLGSSIIFY